MAVALATGVVWALGPHEQGVAIVGSVPGGLPPLSTPPVDESVPTPS